MARYFKVVFTLILLLILGNGFGDYVTYDGSVRSFQSASNPDCWVDPPHCCIYLDDVVFSSGDANPSYITYPAECNTGLGVCWATDTS